MGYAVKSKAKGERQLGFQAVEELLSDPTWKKEKILVYAKLNEKAFVQIDELSDADFCKAMKELRDTKVDAYRFFGGGEKQMRKHRRMEKKTVIQSKKQDIGVFK